MVQEEKSATLATNNDQYLFQPVGFDARGNGDGKTAPTITGDYNDRITDYTALAVTLDCRNAAVNEELSGNLQAKPNGGFSHNCINPVAYGIGRDAFNQGVNAQYKPAIEENLQPTLVEKSAGACAYGIVNGQAASLTLSDKSRALDCMHDKQAVIDTTYIVRRLTPTECARLQGFPDWWTSSIAIPDPTEEQLAEWREIFETHRRIVTHSKKPKTDNQIKKFLAHPHSDAAEYKMWGNGIALPCAVRVMQGIVHLTEDEVNEAD